MNRNLQWKDPLAFQPFQTRVVGAGHSLSVGYRPEWEPYALTPPLYPTAVTFAPKEGVRVLRPDSTWESIGSPSHDGVRVADDVSYTSVVAGLADTLSGLLQERVEGLVAGDDSLGDTLRLYYPDAEKAILPGKVVISYMGRIGAPADLTFTDPTAPPVAGVRLESHVKLSFIEDEGGIPADPGAYSSLPGVRIVLTLASELAEGVPERAKDKLFSRHEWDTVRLLLGRAFHGL